MNLSSHRNCLQVPADPWALGDVARFARALGFSTNEVQREVQDELAYMLLLPVRRPFERLPVLVFHGNEQCVADLVEIQPAETMESRKPLFVNGDRRVENRVVSIPTQNALLLKVLLKLRITHWSIISLSIE